MLPSVSTSAGKITTATFLFRRAVTKANIAVVGKPSSSSSSSSSSEGRRMISMSSPSLSSHFDASAMALQTTRASSTNAVGFTNAHRRHAVRDATPTSTSTTTDTKRGLCAVTHAEQGGGGRSVTKQTANMDNKKSEGARQIDLNPPKGTRDFPPEEMRKRNWLFDRFRQTALQFGFEEFDAPVLESEALFTRKAGEEIQGQLYNFSDKGDRRVSLRPELTPSLARLIMQKGKSLAVPAKWFAIGQCWRYERMTRGRRREHYQWNMDIVGVEGVEAEVELLSAICHFFSSVGITSEDVGIKVNSRKVLARVMEKAGVPENIFANVCVVVDKIEKLPREKIVEELREVGLNEQATQSVLTCMETNSLEGLKNLLGEEDECAKEMEKLFVLARAYGIEDWLVFDASVVRGLAYYTGVVFEGFDRRGELRAICGGGRYDGLISTLGGERTPMVGFGFGDAVIVELLKDRGLMPEEMLKTMNVDDVVFSMDESCREMAMRAASVLRKNGRKVDVVLEDGKKSKWTFKHSERVGAKRLLTIGKKEQQDGIVRVKNLETREEVDVSLDQLERSI